MCALVAEDTWHATVHLTFMAREALKPANFACQALLVAGPSEVLILMTPRTSSLCNIKRDSCWAQNRNPDGTLAIGGAPSAVQADGAAARAAARAAAARPPAPDSTGEPERELGSGPGQGGVLQPQFSSAGKDGADAVETQPRSAPTARPQ